MNKSKFKIVSIIFVALAVIDILDIISKGQVFGYFKKYHPDACKTWDEVVKEQKGLAKLRFDMINKIGEMFKSLN